MPRTTPANGAESGAASAREQLTKLEDHVRERMKELAPLVEEYRELEQIARRLGLSVGRRGRPDSNGPGLPAVREHVPAGYRHKQLLSLIRERPGITVREAAEVLDVDPTSLYRIVRRLVDDGEVVKRGRSLTPRDPR